jgi:hypothetical protein
MLPKIVGVTLAVAGLFLHLPPDARGQKERTGTIIGELKSQKSTPDGKNTVIEVLAPGEEKARRYHVLYDPKAKGPVPSVLAAVRAAKVGDVVEFEWVQTGHGPAIKSFRVFKEGVRGGKKGDDKENR